MIFDYFTFSQIQAVSSSAVMSSHLQLYTFFLFFITEKLPILDNEMFHSIKPGLSAYVDAPEMVRYLSFFVNCTRPK